MGSEFDFFQSYKKYYYYSVWKLEPHKLEKDLKRKLPFKGVLIFP